MAAEYHVRFTGRLQEGLDQDKVVTNLTRLTNLDRDKAEALVSPGKPRMLKKGIDLETAQKYRQVFEKAGMIIQVVKADTAAALGNKQTATAPVQPPPEPPEPSKPNPVGSIPVPPQNTAQENPYEPPKADLNKKEEKSGGWREQPEKVPASNGWQWLRSALSLFFERPWMWMGMWLIFFLSVSALNMIPFIGWILTGLLGGVLSGGMMLAAQAQSNREQVKISDLFLGFSHNRNQLFLVGLYYILVIFAFALVIGSTLGIGMLTGLHSGDQAAIGAMLRSRLPLVLVLVLVASLLAIPLMMAYWFAPALTAITETTAWSAYKSSFKGCLKNWKAFLVYGLALLVAGAVVLLFFGVLSALYASFSSGGGSFLFVLLPFVLFILIGIPVVSIMKLTIFTAFKDIYYQSV